MASALAKPMSIESFLDWEERQEVRFEYDGFRPVAMTGESYAHAQLQFRLARALVDRLYGGPCTPLGSGLKVRTVKGIRYPDAFVICSPLPPTATIAHDPVVIFEILSPSTANDDLGAKNAEYQSIPSLRTYVVLQQTHRSAQVFRRSVEARSGEEQAGDWSFAFVFGGEASIDLPEIGITIPLAEIYDSVLPNSGAAAE